MAKLDKNGLEAMRKDLSAEPSAWIKVGMSTCGIAAGADVVFATLQEEAKKRNCAIEIKRCGCQGMCYAEPMVEVKTEGLPAVLYGKVNKEIAAKIMEKHVCSNVLVKDSIYELRSK
jgi:(2Fe-2S) ferredoxin